MQALNVFISYAHKDEEFRRELQAHLRLMERQGLYKCWHDREITAGTDWKEQISQNLREADIVILLVSSDFLNSDYCYDVEMKAALDAHRSGRSLTIPVIVRSVANWEDSPFGSLQALPTDAKPVSTWDNRDSAWANVASGIIKAVQRWEQEKAGTASGDQRSMLDVIRAVSASSPELERPTSSLDSRILEKNFGQLMLIRPHIASKIAAYRNKYNLDQKAAKKAYDEIMSLVKSKLPITNVVLLVMVLLAERQEQMITLDMQLLSLLIDMEEANLSAYDYGLPSFQEASEKLDKHMQQQSPILGASPQ